MSRFCCVLLLVSALASAVPAQKTIVPIIDLRLGGLLGGSQDGKWVEAGLAAESIMDGGIDLFVFGFNGKEKTPIYSAKRAPVEDVCSDFYRIEMDIKDRLGLGLGVNASWNPMPRFPKPIKTPTAAYKTAITNLLRKEGVKRPVVKTTQIFLIDLDGDGTEEALITATNITSEFGVGWKAGEYSFVMLRKMTKDGVKDHLVDGNIFKTGQDNGGAPNRYEISSIADLNGDGKMEVVIYSEYYEGAGAGAFEMRGGKLELIKGIQAGCGV